MKTFEELILVNYCYPDCIQLWSDKYITKEYLIK